MGLLRKILKKTTKSSSVIKKITTTKSSSSNYVKGVIGETEVDSKLNPLIFGKVEHRQINNLIILDSNGKSHQIDHVEIRENGIFCIETKNYKGWIFGNENQDKWTQTLYNNEKHQFLNPLKQNKSHIYHLSQIIGRKYHINSVVVMVQNNANRINVSNVVNLIDLKSYLKNYNDGTVLTIAEMDEIYEKLLNARCNMSNREHVENIKKTQENLKKGICPRCGGKLIIKQGRYGSFYGCSNYPECNFILKNK